MGYFKLQVLKGYGDTISDVNFFLSRHWMLVFYVRSEFPNTFLPWKTRKKLSQSLYNILSSYMEAVV